MSSLQSLSVVQKPAVSHMLEPPPSISSLTTICLREFLALIELSKSGDGASELGPNLQDELGRLRIWIGNLGAHRKQGDRLSLDHRLREAPGLHSQVRSHIIALIEAVQEVTAVISRTTAAAKSSDHSSSEDDSDIDEEWQRFKEEETDYSELDECLLDIRHTITSLYKLSLSLQNPARRDRTDKAARIDLRHFEFFDIQHASNMFGLSRESVLAQRLGKANTKRRQLLAYHQDHSDQISKYVDVTLEKAKRDPQKGPKSVSTKWTQDTTISTILQSPHSGSDSGRTQFSTTSSTANNQPTESIPPPPKEARAAENEPFFCPYCCQTIQLENLDADWKYHVLSDLRPYICTFGECVKANQLYDSFTEWSEHERQFHRRQLSCSLCSYTCRFADDFKAHLQSLHADNITENQLQAITEASWKPITTSQQCPLCMKPPMAHQRRFQQHLARHLQKLALFVLPRPESEDESQSHKRGSNESQRAVLMNDEELSLSSTSIHEHSPIAEDTKLGEYSSSLGWWTCCECGSGNNPQLAPTRCCVCPHYRCHLCGDMMMHGSQSMGLKSDSGSEAEIKLGQKSRGPSSVVSGKQRSGDEGIHGDKIFDDFRQGTDDTKTAKEEAIARLEKLILDERMERAKREDTQSAVMEREANSPAAPEGSDSRALLEKSVAEKAAADATVPKPAPDQKQSVLFKDCVGRKFIFPFEICNTWQGMETLIKTAFEYIEVIGPHVAEGHYDLVGPNGDIILPQVWETVIEPGWTITMHSWPMPKKPESDHPVLTNPPKPADPALPAVSDVKKNINRDGSFAKWIMGNRAPRRRPRPPKADKKPPPEP